MAQDVSKMNSVAIRQSLPARAKVKNVKNGGNQDQSSHDVYGKRMNGFDWRRTQRYHSDKT